MQGYASYHPIKTRCFYIEPVPLAVCWLKNPRCHQRPTLAALPLGPANPLTHRWCIPAHIHNVLDGSGNRLWGMCCVSRELVAHLAVEEDLRARGVSCTEVSCTGSVVN